MSLAILKNEEGDDIMDSRVVIDNYSFLSWLTDEETIRDEGAIAGKILADSEATIHLITKYHDWQFLQFYRKKGVFNIDESNKNLLHITLLQKEIRSIKDENYDLTRNIPLSNKSFVRFSCFLILNLLLSGFIFYLSYLLIVQTEIIGVKLFVVYSLIIISLLWIFLSVTFPKGLDALKSSFAHWVEKGKNREKFKHNLQAVGLMEMYIKTIENLYVQLPTWEEWEKLSALRKDLFLSEFKLAASFYSPKN